MHVTDYTCLPKRIAKSISCHAWNADRSLLAICPNSNEVWIYEYRVNAHNVECNKKFVLAEHDSIISAIDWHPITNKIVTCSHDRKALVWSWSANRESWIPETTTLTQDRACLDVRWSKSGDSFAVATGSNKVFVLTYNKSNNWWESKEVRRFKSSVLGVAVHPNDNYVAACSSDYTCRVLPMPAVGDDAGSIQKKDIEVFELAKSWINHVAWSPSGRQLAFVSQCGMLYIADLSTGEKRVKEVRCPSLPAMKLMFLSETAIVTVGYDNNPELYAQLSGTGHWSFVCTLDNTSSKKQESGVKDSTSSVAAARAMFSSRSMHGQSSPTPSKITNQTHHRNTIVDVRAVNHNVSGTVSDISTVGIDGNLVLWNIKGILASQNITNVPELSS